MVVGVKISAIEKNSGRSLIEREYNAEMALGWGGGRGRRRVDGSWVWRRLRIAWEEGFERFPAAWRVPRRGDAGGAEAARRCRAERTLRGVRAGKRRGGCRVVG